MTISWKKIAGVFAYVLAGYIVGYGNGAWHAANVAAQQEATMLEHLSAGFVCYPRSL